EAPAVTPVAKDVSVPDDVDRPQAGGARVNRRGLRRGDRPDRRLDGHLRRPIQRLAMARVRCLALTSSSRTARPASLENPAPRLGLLSVSVCTAPPGRRTTRGP